MYKTPELIKKVKLKDIHVPNQDKIFQETGATLDLQKAFEIIKEASQNFKLYDERAIEADGLLASLIEKELNKMKGEDVAIPDNKEVEAKEKIIKEPMAQIIKEPAAPSRKRKLQLIKMKLELEKEKKLKTIK